jgi:hypothetical protein
LLGDIAELEIYTVVYQFSSVANTYAYQIPALGSQTQPPGAPIALVTRVMYQPQGLTYNYEFEPGQYLLSWDEYQQMTGRGYYQQLSFGVQPRYATVNPQRTQLWFYPGSAQAGDTIQVYYAPLLNAGNPVGATPPQYLANATDTPVLPEDCDEAIIQYALSQLWVNAREVTMAQLCMKQYLAEVARIKDRYLKRTKGDIFSIHLLDYPMPLGQEP